MLSILTLTLTINCCCYNNLVRRGILKCFNCYSELYLHYQSLYAKSGLFANIVGIYFDATAKKINIEAMTPALTASSE